MIIAWKIAVIFAVLHFIQNRYQLCLFWNSLVLLCSDLSVLRFVCIKVSVYNSNRGGQTYSMYEPHIVKPKLQKPAT